MQTPSENPVSETKLSREDAGKIDSARKYVEQAVNLIETNSALAHEMIEKAMAAVDEVRRTCAFVGRVIGHDGYNSQMGTLSLTVHAISRNPSKLTKANIERIKRNAIAVMDTLGSVEFWGPQTGLVLQEIDLADFLQTRRRILEIGFHAKEGERTLGIQAPDKLIVKAHPWTLGSALGNMVRNAEKHGEATAIEIRVIANRVGQAVIEVLDNGTGMDESIARRVFELGFSGKGSSGIGMGHVDKRMEAMGGFAKCHPKGGLPHPSSIGVCGAKFELGVPLVLLQEEPVVIPENTDVQMAG